MDYVLALDSFTRYTWPQLSPLKITTGTDARITKSLFIYLFIYYKNRTQGT